jgi:hypothetical protein
MRCDSRAKDFLLDGGQSRTIFAAENFGISAAYAFFRVQHEFRRDPGVAQLQVLAENHNGRTFQSNTKTFFT